LGSRENTPNVVQFSFLTPRIIYYGTTTGE
jgi:hypothetical protein